MNELTEAQKERLIMLAEEAGEVIQAVGKILRHGYNSCHLDNDDISNRLDLVRELDDLNAIIGEMVKKGDEVDAIVLDVDATDDPLHGRQEGRVMLYRH